MILSNKTASGRMSKRNHMRSKTTRSCVVYTKVLLFKLNGQLLSQATQPYCTELITRPLEAPFTIHKSRGFEKLITHQKVAGIQKMSSYESLKLRKSGALIHNVSESLFWMIHWNRCFCESLRFRNQTEKKLLPAIFE